MKFQHITPSKLNREEFIKTFADIYEHSQWVAEKTFDRGLNDQADNIDILHQQMSYTILNASKEEQLLLINAHPDLAGKAAINGNLTESSTGEQKGAGINECTPEEFKRFTDLNTKYKQKFGFPFIKAVTGSNRYQILDAFETRINNTVETEFNTALNEINKIALFRLQKN